MFKYSTDTYRERVDEFGSRNWRSLNRPLFIALMLVSPVLLALPWFYAPNPGQLLSLNCAVLLMLPLIFPRNGIAFRFSLMIFTLPYFFWLCHQADKEPITG